MRAFSLVLGCWGTFACVHAPDVVRERAANEFRCAPSEVEVTRIGGTSYTATGCGETATYTCSTASMHVGATEHSIPCTREVEPTKPAAVASSQTKPASALQHHPEGAGGFAFGVSRQKVRQACETAGRQVSELSANELACSQPLVDIGTPAEVRLAFCGDAVCSVVLVVQPEPQRLADEVARLRALLVDKYGSATTSEATIPSDCNGRLGDCVRKGQAKLRYEWRWPMAYRIELSLLQGQEQPTIRIEYRAPNSASSAASGL